MSYHAAVAATRSDAPAVDIVLPVYNEERDLARSVRRLHAYIAHDFPFSARITIADNASTDSTSRIALRLANELPNVRLVRLNEKGRGRALAAAWLTSDAEVVAYMDVDLSTDLAALLPLVAPLITRHSDVAVGSRLSRGSRVVRSRKREVISRCYNLLLRAFLGANFRDAQCGFKALRADVARRLVPKVENRNWFFDTELLVQAQRAGLRLYEVPVDWVEDADSRVDIVATALEDMLGIVRLALFRLAGAATSVLGGKMARFLTVGAVSTIAYAALYWLLRGWFPPAASNAVALLATAIGNTAANRRFTFGVRGAHGIVRDHAGGLVAFATALVLTNAAVYVMQLMHPAPAVTTEIAILTAVNLAATGVRFLILRTMLEHVRRAEARQEAA